EVVDARVHLVDLRLEPDDLIAQLEHGFEQVVRHARLGRHGARLPLRYRVVAMRIVVSDAGVVLEGWIEVARAGRLRSGVRSGAVELLDTRADDIEELLIVGSLERGGPEYAGALLAATTRLHEGTPITLIVPDAAAVFAAVDAGEATDDELTAWYGSVF